MTEGRAELGSDKILWLECNAAELDGVSFTKGCYVGQENTARMNYRSKVNRRLVVVPGRRAGPRTRIHYPELGLAVEHRRIDDLAGHRAGLAGGGRSGMRILLALLLPLAAGASPASPAPPPVQGYTVVRSGTHTIRTPSPRASSIATESCSRAPASPAARRSARPGSRTARCSARSTCRPHLFGEGIVDWKKQIVSLTWQTGIGFRWDRASFRQLGSFRYPGEGWGLTRNASALVMSDGTPVLRFLDPRTFKVRRRLTVTEGGAPLRDINELEWVDGAILANVWHSDSIVRIDPATGRVTARFDLSRLGAFPNRGEEDSLNGIAWDPAGKRLFVTGKNWPRLYQIRLASAPRR